MKWKARSLLAFALLIFWNIGFAAGLLLPGQGLSAGQRLYSNNSRYFATMQADGNFVVYTGDGKPIWSTNTTGRGADYAAMQSDGNFVLYNRRTGAAVWSSNTAYRLAGFAAVTDYGQWIVFKNTPVWSSNTSDRSNPIGANAMIFGYNSKFDRGRSYGVGKYSVTFQADGNFVLYGPSGAMWSSKTTGKQVDIAYVYLGRLVVDYSWRTDYSTANPLVFQTPTNVPVSQFSMTEWTSTYVALQADGNLVVYVPQRVFTSPSPYAPVSFPISDGPGCYGPPDACLGSTFPIFQYNW
jgi:hypothetical protein